jgi:putative ABC transport system permease protein
MFGRRSQRDFEEEIRAHLGHEAARLRAQGASAHDAELAARRNFGNVGVTADRFYHAQRFAYLQDAGRDLRLAWRALRRQPGFLVTSVGTLAVAIGALTSMFGVVNTVLLRPLPFADEERLVEVAGTAPGSDLPERFSAGEEFYVHYKERSTLLDGIFAYRTGSSTFRTELRVERIPIAWPTNDMYATLGVRPQLGRVPGPEDGDRAILISDRLWSSWFGRDSSVIGKWYFVSDSMKQVIGIMPAEFRFPTDETLLWVSGTVQLQYIRLARFRERVVARMKEGVTPHALATELSSIAHELPARFGGPPSYARLIERHRALVRPLLDAMVPPAARTSLWILTGAAAVVLLVACANVANLFLVRTEARTRDLAVRRAIGASRARLVRLQLAEAFVVALAAGMIAIVVSTVTLPLFLSAAPRGIPRLGLAGVDRQAIVAAFGIAMFAALLCGIGPAFRGSMPDLARLRDGGRGSTWRLRWGRDILVVAQTALALVLLIGSALLVESFTRLRSVDPGYETNDIYTFQFATERPIEDGPSWGGFHLAFMERLRALPRVSGVGLVDEMPLDEGTDEILVRTDATSSGRSGMLLDMTYTAGDYFRVMGIDLLQGRPFSDAEAVTPNGSVIVSRSAAEKLWPGQSAVGRTIRPQFRGTDTLSFTVVGVVEDVKQDDWRQSGEAKVYFPLTGPMANAWAISSPAYAVKSVRAGELRDEVRELVRQIAPGAPVYREYTMDFLAERSRIQLSFTMLTLGVVSGLALLLAAIGLYGVLSYVVVQRTREIGVRMALGATAGTVRRMVVAQGTRVVLLGVAIGIGGAVASTRLLGSLLFGVEAVDPIVFAAMSLTMLAMGMVASYVPAWRASAANPIESLRSD